MRACSWMTSSSLSCLAKVRIMVDPDAIVLADFEDNPTPNPSPSSLVPGAHPVDRPRPDPSSHAPAAGSTSLVAVDTDTRPEQTMSANSERATLEFDVFLFDPETASFLVVYSAGTPLNALKPRTVSIPPWKAGPAI